MFKVEYIKTKEFEIYTNLTIKPYKV